MSTNYESVLIYGYKIPEDEVKRLIEDMGEDAWYEAREKYDGSEKYSLITDSCYYESDWYFGVTLGAPLHLDAIDAICWFEYEEAGIDNEFEKAFGDISYTDTHCPMMYHFVRVC